MRFPTQSTHSKINHFPPMADTSKLCPGLHTSGFLGSFHVCDNIESIPAEDMTAGSCSEYILDTMLFCVLFGRAAKGVPNLLEKTSMLLSIESGFATTPHLPSSCPNLCFCDILCVLPQQQRTVQGIIFFEVK